MAVRLPDFQALGYSNVNPGDVRPTYSGADPVAAGQAALGAGQQKFAAGVETIAGAAFAEVGRQQHAANKLTDALAQASLFERYGDERQLLAHETDPEKVNQIYSRAREHLDAVAQSIPDPTARQLWTAQHLDDASKLQLLARERQQGIFKDRLVAGLADKADALQLQAQQSDDPAIHAQANKGIGELLKYARDAGAITEVQAQDAAKKSHEGIYAGTGHRLLGEDRPEEAYNFLFHNRGGIDPKLSDPLLTRSRTHMYDKQSVEIANGVAGGGGGGLPPGSPEPNPALAAQREHFRAELAANPALKKRLAAIIETENPGAGTAVVESLMNRMVMVGGTLESGMGPAFYGPVRRGEVEPTMAKMSPETLAERNRQIDQALAGSNIVRGHTDQGSAPPGRLPDPNYVAGGVGVNINRERFNDWGGGPGGVAGAREWRLKQQQALGAASGAPAQTGAPAQAVAQSAGPPPLEDQLRQIKAMQLPPELETKTIARATHNDAVRRAEMKTEIENVKEWMKSDVDSRADSGVGNSNLSFERMAAAIGPDEARDHLDDQARADSFYQQTKDLDNLAPGEAMARVASQAPQPGQDKYELQQRFHTKAINMMAHVDKVRKEDPGRAAFASPEVRTAWEAANATAQAAVVRGASPEVKAAAAAASQKFAETTLATQARYEIAEQNRHILSNAGAANIASTVANTDPAKANITTEFLGPMGDRYGEYWPKVFGDLKAAGLPSSALVLASLSDPNQIVAQQKYQRLIQVVAKNGGSMEKIAGEVDKTKKQYINDNIDRLLAPFRDTTTDDDLRNAITEGVHNLAMYDLYNNYGMSANTALTNAVTDVLGVRYDFTDHMRVPKGQAGTMERAGRAKQASIKPEDLQDNLPSRFPLTDAEKREVYLDAINRGFWRTNASDDGAVLYLVTKNGSDKQAKLKDGRLVEFKWSEAPGLAALPEGARRAEPEMFVPQFTPGP